MLGYSDSGKDAGRAAAAWALYKCQEELVQVCHSFWLLSFLVHLAVRLLIHCLVHTQLKMFSFCPASSAPGAMLPWLASHGVHLCFVAMLLVVVALSTHPPQVCQGMYDVPLCQEILVTRSVCWAGVLVC